MNLKTWWWHCWLPACLILLATITHTVSSETRVVCYYTNWSVYRPGTAKFSPQNINPYLCTHLIYAFGGFTKENSLKPFDKYQDIEKGGYAKFTGLKTYNKNLKTMLAIGGWNEGSSRFSPMVASADRRKELVKNTIKFLRQNHFDGLDLDWEYPSFRDGGKARDKENYAQLVQELREEFDRESEKTGRPRLLLTMAVPAGIEYINKGYDIPKLNKFLDWMNILSYDYHSAFEPAVNHHSPLYSLEEENEYNFDTDLNIDHTIKHYLKLGADSSKLVLGIPTYGRSYTLFNPDANELGAPADGPGDMGDATRENGYLAYYEICENLKENDWKVVQPNPDAMGPYAYKNNQWVSYDDELIVKKKSEYVVDNNLGGIMFWSIDNDDFRGNCYNKPYPLIEAAKESLLTATSSKTDDNLIKPRKPASRSRSRPNYIKKETDATTARIQNSGGRQSFEEIPSSGSRKRIRTGSRNRSNNEGTTDERKEIKQRTRTRGSGRRRKTTTTTPITTITSTTPSTLPTTPMYKTPEPPTTPDPGGDFKCEEDGFFPHPRDCKKYFWCLSGPADLGIIAHQFTCPAGLYFNKAADSCDYTQNVLCNKKLKTTSTTTVTPATTSSTTTTSAPSTTTRRPLPRITAATSKTTFLYTSTTTTEEPEYYDDYEYDDDEDLEDNAPRKGDPDSEEDPRVIKELIDLIKKVGGIEELEKYLQVQENGSMSVTNSGSTTPATISRSLYERVLQGRNSASKTNTVTAKTRNSLIYSSINRNKQNSQDENLEKPETNNFKRSNSRFAPQNEGLEKPDTSNESSLKRGRPQYTTITRQRASTERSNESENESEDEEISDDENGTKKTRQFSTRKQNAPEYVTIRRSRPTTATEAELEDDETPTRSSIRGRQRGIPGETADDGSDTASTQRPEYVTIRRNRPATDEVSTSKYTTIQRKRPGSESSEDAETTTDNSSSKRRSTTVSPEEDSLEKEKRYRSTTISNLDESSTLTTLNTDTTLEDSKKTTTEKESTVTQTVEGIKSTLEEATDSADKLSTQSATELSSNPESAQKSESTTEVLSTDKSNQISDSQAQEVKEVSSEKNTASPQLFRPRPFTTRTRSTTTAKPTEVTEASTKKVSDSSGIKFSAPGRPLIRKFQPGNRFAVRVQGTQSQTDSNNDSNKVNIRTTTEEIDAGTEEIDFKQRDEEYRRRIINRGRAKFTLPTSTAEPTVARRRRPPLAVTTDYEYSDYEDIQRTYRPTVLADLSSLTSADITFRRDNNRKHIRRRPVTETPATPTDGPTEPGLKTGPRTLTLARKQITESSFGRNNKRIISTQNQKSTEISTTGNTFNDASTKTAQLLKPRPAYAALFRPTTQKSTTENINETTSETETVTVNIKSRIRFSEAPPLVRSTDVITAEIDNEVTESTSFSVSTTTEAEEIDSTESNSDKDYKTLKPETKDNNEVTELPEYDVTISSTTELQEQSPLTKINRFRSTTVANEDDTTTNFVTTQRNLIRRIRPSTTTISSSSEISVNRTRKVFLANRRTRPTTPVPTEKETSNTETIRTTVDFKRQRPLFLSLRTNQTNITRLKPVKSEGEELETNTTSESNRGLVKRIRPIGLASKIDEEEKIKLSETNISENDYLGTVRNLPEDDSGKYRRRKIVRRIRPNKDAIFSKTEEVVFKNPGIKITDKSVLTAEQDTTEELTTLKIRGKSTFLDLDLTTTTKDDVDSDTEQTKRTRPSKDSLFSKSESIDLLRAKRIRFNGKEETQTENNTEKDEDKIIKRIRQGKKSTLNDSTDNITTENDSQTDGQNINTSTLDSDFDQTSTYESTTDLDQNKKRLTSSYKSTNAFRGRRIRPTISKDETNESEDVTNKRIKLSETTTAETPSTFRPRNFIRKFRPGITESNSEFNTAKLSAANIKFVENNRASNRTRKIIRRLRPTATSTTEDDIPQSTFSEIPTVSTTTENNIFPFEEIITTNNENVDTTEPIIETTEFSLTTIEDGETTIFTTESETTTTTSTTPRPTRPSLIGRSRPPYRPRGRPLTDNRSSTQGSITDRTFRRRLNRTETTNKPELEKEETEDGIIDSKLKKLYNKKLKYTPIVRSTTERLRALEEDKIDEDTEITATTVINTSDKISTEKVNETTMNDQTEVNDITTTENYVDSTTIPEDLTTFYNSERITTVTDNKQTESITQSTTETEIKSTTSLKTIENTSEFFDNLEIDTTESKTEFDEIPTTEFMPETTIPAEIYGKSFTESTTDSSTQETSTSEITTNLENISNEPTVTENENREEPERPYKPIRYKPSDRPKLKINLNRTEVESEKNENDEPKNRKFTPSRTLNQRNRSKLAYRKETTTEKPKEDVPERTFVPKGRKIDRPGLQNQNIHDEKEEKEEKDLPQEKEDRTETEFERSHYPTLKPVSERFNLEKEVNKERKVQEQEENIEIKSERTHYPTLRPVSESFNLYINQDEETDKEEENDENEYEGEVTDEELEQEQPPIENPLVKYLQTIRNNQQIIKTTLNQDEEIDAEYPAIDEEEEEDEEDFENEEEENSEDEKTKVEYPKFNPSADKPTVNRPISNQPNRVVNIPQYTLNRPAVSNQQQKPSFSSGNRPFNPHEANRPISELNKSFVSNRTSIGRNYTRRFNQPINSVSSSTTPESLAGINIEAVNARNKNLYSKNRKANIPHPGPAASTTVNDTTISISDTPSTVETTTPKIEVAHVTEETILPEPTTEQLSTLHHVFAEPEIPTTPISPFSNDGAENTTRYNFTAAQIEAARSLEKLIEVNRIVEVSLKEDKVKNSSGIVETRVMLEKIPTFDRIGAINRVTVIKVVDGGNETETSPNFPSNHAVTLNEIVTGKRIDSSQKIDIVAQLHAPDINLTKMNILNNTLEIIETQRQNDKSKELTSQENSSEEAVQPTEISQGEKIPEGITVHIVNGPKILDQIINDTVLVNPDPIEKKFEINSKSNVVDYSRREFDPSQIIASAQPADNIQAKQGRKLAIDSKSVVVNNNNVRPIFVEATTLPLEALFHTDSPDYNLLKESGGVTPLPTLKEVVTGRENYVDDDQDLLESRNVNGRIRIRILGQDNEFTQLEQDTNPIFAPIRVLKEEDKEKSPLVDSLTLRADVIEITPKSEIETIRIAPVEVSISQPQTIRVPIVRIESSQSSSLSKKTENTRNLNSVPLKRELPSEPKYFNPEIIFGERAATEIPKSK